MFERFWGSLLIDIWHRFPRYLNLLWISSSRASQNLSTISWPSPSAPCSGHLYATTYCTREVRSIRQQSTQIYHPALYQAQLFSVPFPSPQLLSSHNFATFAVSFDSLANSSWSLLWLVTFSAMPLCHTMDRHAKNIRSVLAAASCFSFSCPHKHISHNFKDRVVLESFRNAIKYKHHLPEHRTLPCQFLLFVCLPPFQTLLGVFHPLLLGMFSGRLTHPLSQNIHNPFPSTWCTQRHCENPQATPGPPIFFAPREIGRFRPTDCTLFHLHKPNHTSCRGANFWAVKIWPTFPQNLQCLVKSSYNAKRNPCTCRYLRPIFDEATLFFKGLTRTSAPNRKENLNQKILLGATSELVKKHLILNSTHSPSVEITSKPTGSCRLKASLFMFSNLSNLSRFHKNHDQLCPSILIHHPIFWGDPIIYSSLSSLKV